MIVEEHPTAAQLTAFGLGKLDDAECLAIEAHVVECETCRRHLETQAADSFVALARSVRSEQTCIDAPARPVAPCVPTCALTDTAAPASTEVPLELADHPRYRILGLIGVGGMGAVFKAEHLLMHRVVALKVINRRLVANPAMVERFTREVIAAGNLSHPNIVHYHDAEHIGDTHFLVMEHVEGTNLAKLMAEIGPLPIAQACEYIRQAALGLQHAFERGMVHRDIKPQNLMAAGVRSQESGVRSQESEQPVVKILDFGLARLAQETEPTPVDPVAETRADQGKDTPSGTLTQIGTVMGTPDYIAPEQARDAHAADIRSDIYSLGCTLYDLLTGKPPFPEGTVMQKVIAHLEQTPRPVAELRADVQAELARVVEKMLAKDPGQRYQTPAEVAAALAPFTSESEAPAREGDALASASGSGRRRRWGWAAAGAALLVVIASLFLPPVQDCAQTVIRIATNKGVLEIEADDEDLEITIKQAGKEPRVEMVDRKTRKTFELTAVGGELVFREKGGDLRLTSSKFELSRGDRTFIRARILLAEVKTDRELIQGTWKPVRVEIQGMPVPDLVFQTLDPHIAITGAQVVWKLGPNTLPNFEGEITLDPSKSPKTINMIVFDKANKERKVLLGIYRLEGDTLEICSALNPDEPADRPKEFKSVAKGFVGHIVLQRASGAELREPAFQPLFNGKVLTGWKTSNPESWKVKDGILSGTRGNLQYERQFGDFHCRMEIKVRGMADFGFRGTLENWVGAPIGDKWLAENSGSLTQTEKGEKTVLVDHKNNWFASNEWFTLEIIAQGKTVTIKANGKTTAQKTIPRMLDRGFIDLKVDEPNSALYVRRFEIKELPPSPPEPAFQPLFNGKDLTGWTSDSNIKDSWAVFGDFILCKGAKEDETPLIRTVKEYENYVLKMQWRFPRQLQGAEIDRAFGHSVHLHMGSKELRKFYFMQSSDGNGLLSALGAGRNFVLEKSKGELVDTGKFPMLRFPSPTKPFGEWNDLVITCQDGRITVESNGTHLLTARNCVPRKGHIGLQGRGLELHYRNVEIQELPSLPPEPAFQPLFNGKDTSNWDMALADNWRFEDNRLICRGSGGMLRPKKLDLREFHLRIEARHFGEGAYLRLGPQLFQTPDKQSETAHQHVLLSPVLISAAGTIGMDFGGKDLTGGIAQKDRTKPGEWYTLDVIHEGRYVRTLINGEQAAEFVVTEPGALVGLGLLGFNQEDKNGELQIRKIEIRDLSADPNTAAKRLQGYWTPVQAIRGAVGKDAAFSKADLKAFALEFDKDRLKCGLFPDATFHLSAPDRITIKYRGPAKQMMSADATYRLTHDILSLDFADIDLPFGPAAPKTEHGEKPLQLALFRYYAELVPLFNGKNLHGFVNDREHWTWQGDTLVGVRRASDNNADLLFRPGMPNLRDFELEFQVRMQGQAPVGILFRGGANKENVGLIANGPMLSIGGMTPGGLWNRNLDQLLKIPPAEKIKAVKPDDFNHYVLRCVGKRVTVQINGVTMLDDELDVLQMQPAGKLAWALLDTGKAGTVSFREIRLRVLPSP